MHILVWEATARRNAEARAVGDYNETGEALRNITINDMPNYVISMSGEYCTSFSVRDFILGNQLF